MPFIINQYSLFMNKVQSRHMSEWVITDYVVLVFDVTQDAPHRCHKTTNKTQAHPQCTTTVAAVCCLQLPFFNQWWRQWRQRWERVEVWKILRPPPLWISPRQYSLLIDVVISSRCCHWYLILSLSVIVPQHRHIDVVVSASFRKLWTYLMRHHYPPW